LQIKLKFQAMAVEQSQHNNFDTFEKSSNNDDSSNITYSNSNSNSHNENIFNVNIHSIFPLFNRFCVFIVNIYFIFIN
jgi:hypothetical protein